jgi:hypothetical protein
VTRNDDDDDDDDNDNNNNNNNKLSLFVSLCNKVVLRIGTDGELP